MLEEFGTRTKTPTRNRVNQIRGRWLLNPAVNKEEYQVLITRDFSIESKRRHMLMLAHKRKKPQARKSTKLQALPNKRTGCVYLDAK